MSRTTRREDLITVALGMWVIIGLFVDAYNHVTNPELETFWTPWHGLFYSGFAASAFWIVSLSLRRRQAEGGVLDWAPHGYRAALIGLVVFLVGGIGDAIWHTVFGVETSLDALLSPTHLTLLVGGLMMLSAPLRAAWSDPGTEVATSMTTFIAPLMSLVLTMVSMAFFVEYAWAPAQTFPMRSRYVAGESDFVAAFGVLGVIVTTLLLMGCALIVTRRWPVPFGSLTLLFTIPTVLIAVGFDADLSGAPAVIIAGIVADLLVARGANRWLLATGVPVVMWSLYFITLARTGEGLRWPPELWGGAIVFGVFVGGGIELLLSTSLDADRHRDPVGSGDAVRR